MIFAHAKADQRPLIRFMIDRRTGAIQAHFLCRQLVDLDLMAAHFDFDALPQLILAQVIPLVLAKRCLWQATGSDRL